MKRIFILAVALSLAAILSLSLASCNGKKIKSDDNRDKPETPAFDSYNAYVEAKANLFSSFTTKIYDKKELVQAAGGGLLSLSSSDIEFLPLALFQDTERAGGSFVGNAKGCYSCDAKITDGNFSFEYTTYGGQREKITGSFDNKSGLMFCEKYKDGVVALSLEYIPTESGYKAQYVMYDDESLNVIRIVFGGGGSGYSSFEASDAERLCDISDESFLADTHILIREQGDKIFASIDGKQINS